MRQGQYKFIVGYTGENNDWYIPPELAGTSPTYAEHEYTPTLSDPKSYRNYFPEEWDRYLFDLHGEAT